LQNNMFKNKFQNKYKIKIWVFISMVCNLSYFIVCFLSLCVLLFVCIFLFINFVLFRLVKFCSFFCCDLFVQNHLFAIAFWNEKRSHFDLLLDLVEKIKSWVNFGKLCSCYCKLWFWMSKKNTHCFCIGCNIFKRWLGAKTYHDWLCLKRLKL